MAQRLKIHVSLRGPGFNSQYSCGCSQPNPSTHVAAHNQILVPTWLLTATSQYPRGFAHPSVSSYSRGSSFPSGLHGHQAGIWYQTHIQAKRVRTWFKKWGHAKGILSAHRKIPRKQYQSFESSISSKTQNCSWICFTAPPRYSRQE